MATFQFYLQSGKERSMVGGQVGEESHVLLDKNSLVKKEV
jgi:hypothetical protein